MQYGEPMGDAYHKDVQAPSIRPMVSKREMLRERPDLTQAFEELDDVFAVRVTRTFWDRMDPADPNDPLARQVLPDPRELEEQEGALMDPVGECRRVPIPWVVHKHPDRVLLLMTKRCHLYCRFCFRRTHDPSEGLDPTPEEWETAMQYALNAGASEVILSGGDPLAVNDRRLEDTLLRLNEAGLTIRVHTRAPVTYPKRITERLLAMFQRVRSLWVIVHCNHERELSADVDDALSRLNAAGIPVLCQSVLLAGVNDDEDTLVALFEALVRRKVFPYYLHHTDRVVGSHHFWVDADEGLRLYERVRRRVSGLALPRYVIDMPDGTGKVDVSSAHG